MPHHSQNKVVRFVGETRFPGSVSAYKKTFKRRTRAHSQKKFLTIFRLQPY
jgi:hypothetical protein